MNKIQKPEWLIFAEQFRVGLDNMKPTKSGKREADSIYRAWLEATERTGYKGSAYDWQCLIRRLGRMKKADNL